MARILPVVATILIAGFSLWISKCFFVLFYCHACSSHSSYSLGKIHPIQSNADRMHSIVCHFRSFVCLFVCSVVHCFMCMCSVTLSLHMKSYYLFTKIALNFIVEHKFCVVDSVYMFTYARKWEFVAVCKRMNATEWVTECQRIRVCVCESNPRFFSTQLGS